MRYLLLVLAIVGFIVAMWGMKAIDDDYDLLAHKVEWQGQILEQYRSGASPDEIQRNEAAMHRYFKDRTTAESPVVTMFLIWIGPGVFFAASHKWKRDRVEEQPIIGYKSETR